MKTLAANDLMARLGELALLKDGWLDGSGMAPTKTGLEWLSNEWRLHPKDLPDPYAYPTEDGDVQLEWTLGKWEISAVIDLDRKTAILSGVEVASKEHFEERLDLKNQAGWRRLAERVRERTA